MTSKQILLKMNRPVAAACIASVLLGAGCGSGVHVAAPAATATTNTGPQTYFSGSVNSENGPLGFTNELGTYTIDDSTEVFSESSYLFGTTQNGPQLNYSGNVATLARGLLSLSTTYVETASGPSIPNIPIKGTWAIEAADRFGGLVALNGFPFTPLVAAQGCPGSPKPQSYNFVTIPTVAASGPVAAWDPQLETAYGSVNVSGVNLSGDGSSVLFAGIQQFAMDGTPIRNYSTIGIAPAPVAYTSIIGECSPTFYGQTTSVTGTLAISNPGVGETVENSATLGIGPSGMLVESNGNGYTVPGFSSATVLPTYQPFLGAGTGALGLPAPPSALTTSELTGAQYLGFFFGFNGTESSTVASFGFPSALPASCASVTKQTATLIYGGDFADNDPSAAAVQANGGFGNCNAAIDLGAQSATQNGLFPNATVTEGSAFAGSTGAQILPAVAIAGTLHGKFAIFLITSTGQGVYLLQSN